MKEIILNATSPYEVPLDKAGGARLWKAFLRGGTSHSGRATTLPYIIRRCEREGIPYELQAVPGCSYFIKPSGKPIA